MARSPADIRACKPRWFRLETGPRLLPGVVEEHCSRRVEARLDDSKNDITEVEPRQKHAGLRAVCFERTFRGCDDRLSISTARSGTRFHPFAGPCFTTLSIEE